MSEGIKMGRRSLIKKMNKIKNELAITHIGIDKDRTEFERKWNNKLKESEGST